jgi:hypothetical protein
MTLFPVVTHNRAYLTLKSQNDPTVTTANADKRMSKIEAFAAGVGLSELAATWLSACKRVGIVAFVVGLG